MTLSVRIWLSSGNGDFWIDSINKKSVFYCATFISNLNIKGLSDGVKEYTLKCDDPIFNLSSAKTSSYLTNCLMANFAKKKGGY